MEHNNLNNAETAQLGIGAFSGGISETAMNWWYDLSDYKTDELILKHRMRKPIKEDKIIDVYKIEFGG